MTVRKNNKKSHPTYILLTAQEQLSITLTLLNFSSLARGMLRPSGAQDKFSQGRQGAMGLDYTPLLARIILPVADCLQRVDFAVERLDSEFETFHRAFDTIQKQFDRIHGMMDRIMDMMALMSMRNTVREEQKEAEDNGISESDASVKVCECGRPIPGTSRGEETIAMENASKNDSESDAPDAQKMPHDDVEPSRRQL